MLATAVRRAASSKRSVALLQNQRRHGGSLHKNKHVENYNNWRGDSEKRFKFDGEFFYNVAVWGVIPMSIYYAMSTGERRKRDERHGLPENFRG